MQKDAKLLAQGHTANKWCSRLMGAFPALSFLIYKMWGRDPAFPSPKREFPGRWQEMTRLTKCFWE